MKSRGGGVAALNRACGVSKLRFRLENESFPARIRVLKPLTATDPSAAEQLAAAAAARGPSLLTVEGDQTLLGVLQPMSDRPLRAANDRPRFCVGECGASRSNLP